MPEQSSDFFPDWFDLSNYEICGEMGLKEWCVAFEAREYLFFLAEKNATEGLAGVERRLFNELFQRHSRRVDRELIFQDEMDYAIERADSELLARTVTPLTLGAIGARWHSLETQEDVAQVANNLRTGNPPEDEELMPVYDELYEKPYELAFGKIDYNDPNIVTDTMSVLATIMLEAPEEILVRDFRAFIREYKSMLGVATVKNRFTKVHFTKWHKNKVLAYLDLIIWQKYRGVIMTHQQIGIALFPDEIEVSLDDRIRRTVAPMAMEMIQPVKLAALSVQVCSEYPA